MTRFAVPLLLACTALAACAGTPPPPPSLTQARGDLNTAINGPAENYSRPELDQARQKLDQANAAAQNEDMLASDRLAQEALADLRLSMAVADVQQAQAAEKQLRATTNSLQNEVERPIPPAPPAPPPQMMR